VVNRSPQVSHSLRRRIARPCSAGRLSTTRVSAEPQKGQFITGRLLPTTYALSDSAFDEGNHQSITRKDHAAVQDIHRFDFGDSVTNIGAIGGVGAGDIP
jgi:hypothetical protein